jgi:hypothetical protein
MIVSTPQNEICKPPNWHTPSVKMISCTAKGREEAHLGYADCVAEIEDRLPSIEEESR